MFLMVCSVSLSIQINTSVFESDTNTAECLISFALRRFGFELVESSSNVVSNSFFISVQTNDIDLVNRLITIFQDSDRYKFFLLRWNDVENFFVPKIVILPQF